MEKLALAFVFLVAFLASLATCSRLGNLEYHVDQQTEESMRVLSDNNLAAMNAWIEARGESFEGLVAVCEVMRNRMKQSRWDVDKDNHVDVVEVVLAPYQFSGWNTKDPNRLKALTIDDQDPGYIRAVNAWEMSKTSNLTKGATMYYNPKVIHPAPVWAKPELRVAVIGNHEFFVEG